MTTSPRISLAPQTGQSQYPMTSLLILFSFDGMKKAHSLNKLYYRKTSGFATFFLSEKTVFPAGKRCKKAAGLI